MSCPVCKGKRYINDHLCYLCRGKNSGTSLIYPREVEALEIIRSALNQSAHPIIAFSGGKDSTVVLHLVRRVLNTVPAEFCNTGVEHKHTIQFCKTISNLVELHPKTTFWEVISQYGWPEIKHKAKSHGNMCCIKLRETPMDIYERSMSVDLVFTGLTMNESFSRRMVLKHMGHTYLHKRSGRIHCHPIYNWTEKDVWEYIERYSLKFNEVYLHGYTRCGCLPCTAYLNWYQVLLKNNPKLLKIVLKLKGA